MNPRLLLILCLTLCNLNSKADWVPKCSGDGWNSLIFQKIFYLNDKEAFATGGLGYIYHTLNNWVDFEKIYANLPATEQVEYLEMTSPTKGILVSRSVFSFGYGSSFIYKTENGGYKWEKVFTLPIPNPSIRYDIGAEDMFFQRKGAQLFILFGDIICYGTIDSKQWNTVRYPFPRDTYNYSFSVLNDSIWCMQFGIDKPYTKNKGKSWSPYLTDPDLGEHGSSLGNSIQRINTTDFQNYNIEEYSFKSKTWTLLNYKFAMEVKKILQLSDNYLLISYYYWPVSKVVHTVYDRKDNVWIDLDTLSNFFDLNKWFVKDKGFVTITWDGRLIETKDFGQTWKAIISEKPNKSIRPQFLSFNKNMGVSLSEYGDFIFSTNSGETWKFISSDSMIRFLPGITTGISLSHQNDAELYLLSNKLKRIVPNNDSFKLVDAGFRYMGNTVLCDNISDRGLEGIFVLGVLDDSLYLFKSNANGDLTSLFSKINPGRNGNMDRLLIQNKNYVVFSADKSIYSYNKQTEKITILTDSLYNSVFSLDFATEEIIVAGTFLSTFIYDFSTNKLKTIMQSNNDIAKYGWFRSMATDGNGGLLLSNYNVLYRTSISNFNTLVLDSTFKSESINEIVRYWNGHYWVGTFWNIYKNEPINNTEPACLEIQTIWPNPVENLFTIRIKTKANSLVKFQCYNSLGQLINDFDEFFEEGLYDKMIDLENLSNGMYYFKVTSPCGSKVFKLILN